MYTAKGQLDLNSTPAPAATPTAAEIRRAHYARAVAAVPSYLSA